MATPVFLDPSGRRSVWVARLGLAFSLLVIVCSVLFARTLMSLPLLPHREGESEHRFRPGSFPFLSSRQEQLERFLLRRARTSLFREIDRDGKALPSLETTDGRFGPYRTDAFLEKPVKPISSTRSASSDAKNASFAPIVAAFYVTYQATGLNSLRANASKLTHLMPEWLHLSDDGSGLDLTDWNPALSPRNGEVVKIARANGLQIQPILNNAEGGQFDGQRVTQLLASPTKQQLLAHATRDWLLSKKFDGLNLDLESLTDADKARFPAFVALLGRTLHAAKLTLSVDVEADDAALPMWKNVAPVCDFLILMAYDEHSAEADEPGAIASAQWSYQTLQQFKTQVPARKIVLGMGNYAYDWTRDRTPAQTLTYQGAIALARDYRRDTTPEKAIDFDPDALQTTFEYSDDLGRAHEVWLADGVSAFNQWKLAQRDRAGNGAIRGAALWVLGSEDPTLWSFFDRAKIGAAPSPDGLRTVRFPLEVGFQGKGEILSVHALPQVGQRQLTIDDKNGLITDIEYSKYPSPYLIMRSGFRKKAIALTFDDGPQAGYTEPILDVLKRNNVPGTFFMIGENAERNPRLVSRVYNEGHEIGSHTFTHPNLGEVSKRRVELELNATQRALESILGRSTVLFRPPYNADAEPQTEAEVAPIAQASQMGYVTVGELIDPQDWNRTKNGVDGARTADDLTETILDEVHRATQKGNGNMLLLHDGGGDRSNTVAALANVIPQLKSEGYSFVSVSDLMGVKRDAVMPKVSAREHLLVGFDRAVFNVVFWLQNGLRLAFIAAIVLGLGRVFFVVPLALFAWKRDQKAERALSSTRNEDWPRVSVLVAAYNEEKVIVRTIRSILGSQYARPFEVVVVDDGSRDGTFQEVETHFKDDARVRLIHQQNGGKASALNNAIRNANGEVLVCFDADTQIAPDAVALLARHFADAQVGAVAGNVKVGNRINLLTRWQSLEYITSQNLDRRAYALLNAITVVPGATGAWRRSAVLQAGGYTTDTLAEDMDLTWRIRRAGWKLATESGALAWTEAPDTVKGFFNQRFRWAYGTLQCLWKHRDALGRYGWFGGLALPMLWLFQFVFQVIAPLVDLQILVSLIGFVTSQVNSVVLHRDWQPMAQAKSDLATVLFFYAVFFAAELLGAIIAFRLDKERARALWWLFPQRFVYRQLMYAVVWKALWKAARGLPQGWGKLQRKGTVQTPTSKKENVAPAP